MANKIDVNLLSKEVMEYLENYVEDIEEQVETVTNEVGKDAVKELKEKSPHGKGKRNKPYYNSLEEYLKYSKENGYELAVTKYSPKVLDNERTLNYQYVQCLDLNDEDITNLLKDNILEIEEILGCNPVKSILPPVAALAIAVLILPSTTSLVS